jgi:hypothetical protein
MSAIFLHVVTRTTIRGQVLAFLLPCPHASRWRGISAHSTRDYFQLKMHPALIARRIPLIIVPPMVAIPLGVTNEDYRSHFSSAFGASIGVHNTLMAKALKTFHCAGTSLLVFRTDLYLFPRYKTYAIDDYSSTTDNCYPCQEGARMVVLANEALPHATHTKGSKRQVTITDDISSSSLPKTKRDGSTRPALAIRSCKGH